MVGEHASSSDPNIGDIVEILGNLSPPQIRIIRAIIARFACETVGNLERDDFMPPSVFEYFSMRLAAHHAFSSSVLKKENFEHILEEGFASAGVAVSRPDSKTARGADVVVDGVPISLKTEASKRISASHIVISKLMEAAWIKNVESLDDIPNFISTMVIPHFANYARIFILRNFPDPRIGGHSRYDLREIPKSLLMGIGELEAGDFSQLTASGTTNAEVSHGGRRAFCFRLDGSDDKLTITHLDVDLCPLHAWWSLPAPTSAGQRELPF